MSESKQHETFSSAEVDTPQEEIEAAFVPLLSPLPPLTNELPMAVRKKGGFMRRMCYDQYYEEIMNQVKQDCRLFILTGSPGIGKSFFYLYFASKLIQEKHAEFVIMTTMAYDQPILIWDSVQQKFYYMKSSEYEELYLKMTTECDAWLLTDGPNKTTENISPRRLPCGKTLWFLSPNKSIIDPLQLKSDADVLYMPSWTFNELTICNRLLEYIKMDDLSPRFELFGGIPRFIFSQKQDTLNAKLQEALENSNIVSYLDLLSKQSCFLDEFSHKLLLVDPIGFRNYSLKFVSRYIEDKVISNYKQHIPKQMLAFIQVTQGKSTISGVRGAIFERFAHAVLCHGGEFQVRNLRTNKSDKMDFPKREYSWYRVIDEKIVYEPNSQGTNKYSRPRSRREAAFDAFDDHHFFQTTVSPKKRVKLAYIEQNLLIRKLLITRKNRLKFKGKRMKLMFVVPDDIFPSYQKAQSYDSDFIPSWVDDLEQYAICIPTNLEFLRKLEGLEGFFDQL